MKNKYKLFLPIVIIFLGFSAMAECPNMGKPKLNIQFKYGKVHYINNKSSSGFPGNAGPNATGLTVSDLKTNVSGETKVMTAKNGSQCITIGKLDVSVGFPRIDVYIDKKYRPGTCNYKVIKEHENYHVRVYQEGLKFFSKKIKEAYQIALNNLKPVELISGMDGQDIANKMLDQIEKDVQPLNDYVMKKLIEQNLVIDTEDSYQQETDRCPEW